jgi:hypothetical protein
VKGELAAQNTSQFQFLIGYLQNFPTAQRNRRHGTTFSATKINYEAYSKNG